MTFFNFLYRISRKTPGMSRLLRILYSCDIPRKAKIASSVSFAHGGLGTIIHPKAIIDENVFIQHHVTIGMNSDHSKAPHIHKNVFIGPYAMILGDVNIGENSVIGAGTLVMNDIEANSVYINDRTLIKLRENK